MRQPAPATAARVLPLLRRSGLSLLAPLVPKRVVISDAAEAARGLDEWGSAEATALGAIYTDHLTAIEGAAS